MGAKICLIGKTFGMLTVISEDERRGSELTWLCRCECGREKSVRGSSLRHGQTTSCGCRAAERGRVVGKLPKAKRDITGKRYGRLIAVEFVDNNHRGACRWRFVCDCGKEIVAEARNIKNGHRKSCGCLNTETRRARAAIGLSHTHDMSKSPEYKSWTAMKHRCKSLSRWHWRSYGRKGVQVCDGLRVKFEQFLAVMGPRPHGYQIDRIDNGGNYSCGQCDHCRMMKWGKNVRWVPVVVNVQNRDTCIPVEIDGIKTCVSGAARMSGNLPQTAYYRMKHYDMDPLTAATKPTRMSQKRKELEMK